MLVLKRSPVRSAIRSFASSAATILRFPTRQEAVSADPVRRRLMAGTLAAALPFPAALASNSVENLSSADVELLQAEQDWLATRGAIDEAGQRVSEADTALYDYLGSCPLELVPSEAERDAANRIAKSLNRSWWGATFG